MQLKFWDRDTKAFLQPKQNYEQSTLNMLNV